ncbi:MAG: transposase [Eubacteriales bacterium]
MNGAYFITVCTNNRKKLFWEVGADSIRPQSTDRLSPMGKIVETAIQNIPKYYDGVTVEKYVVMPDHIHLMVMIGSNDGRMTSAPTISTIVGQTKRWVSKQIGTSIWQKSFHDHVIRNEEDFQNIWAYIENNPRKYWLQKDERFAGG